MTEPNIKAAAIPTNPDADFVDVQTERLLYKIDRDTGLAKVPATGWVLDLIEMPEGENGPWQAVVMLATRETIVRDREKKDHKVLPGEEFLVKANAVMKRQVEPLLSPDRVYELRMTPAGLIKLPGNRNLQNWKFARGKKSIAREGFALPPSTAHVPQIANGTKTVSVANDLPF